jgi:hypothetical protein
MKKDLNAIVFFLIAVDRSALTDTIRIGFALAGLRSRTLSKSAFVSQRAFLTRFCVVCLPT